MMMWVQRDPRANPELLGLLPSFLSDEDPDPARTQLNRHYGWDPFEGHTMLPDGSLTYPGDPPLRPLFETRLRDEVVRLYQFGWVAVIQSDGSFEVCRMD